MLEKTWVYYAAVHNLFIKFRETYYSVVTIAPNGHLEVLVYFLKVKQVCTIRKMERNKCRYEI
jgi:hypothetical protein